MARRTLSAALPAALFLLLVCAAILMLVSKGAGRAAFDSHEVRFTDASRGGLAIMPASCSSNPSYFHTALPTSGDGIGYVTNTGQTEYGASKHGVYLCVTNSSGASYFIPANSATELNSFKNRSTVIPGLSSW